MKTKQIKEEIIKMIKSMENNTFLLPESWSDLVQMSSQDYSYRTYVGSRGNGRYINIEKYIDGGKVLSVEIRGNDIYISDHNLFKNIKPIYVYEFIKEVYKEKHSFENHNEGQRKVRKKIADLNKQISQNKKDITKLEQELLDSINITNKD